MGNYSTQNNDTEAAIKHDIKHVTTEERLGRLTKTKSNQSDEEEQGSPQMPGEINSS